MGRRDVLSLTGPPLPRACSPGASPAGAELV